MKTKITALKDTVTMAGRCLLLSKRNPDTFLTSIVLPVLMMFLFVALFGSLIRVEGVSYATYIVPGVLLQCLGQCSSVTAIAVNRDTAGGMADRFAVLPICPSAILSGHILEALVRNGLTSLIVLLAAALLGFRPSAGPADWGVVFLLLFGVMLAFSWLAAVIGLAAHSAEGASGLFTFAVLLPYLSSGFVPVEAMPKALAAFARYQPMTPVIDAMRAALLGKPVEAQTLLAAVLWCAGGALVFWVLALRLFYKRGDKSAASVL